MLTDVHKPVGGYTQRKLLHDDQEYLLLVMEAENMYNRLRYQGHRCIYRKRTPGLCFEKLTGCHRSLSHTH